MLELLCLAICHKVIVIVMWISHYVLCVITGDAVQCYQCDSNEDMSCPADTPFDTQINAVVDCNSFEAHTPGQFCMKIVQESPGCKFTYH